MRSLLLSLLALSALSACGRDVRVATRQVNRICPGAVNIARSGGEACSSPQDCTEVCCRCPNTDKSFTVATCIDDTCGHFAESCDAAIARDATLCQG